MNFRIILVFVILIISTIIIFIACESKPTKPEYNNVFDPGNPTTAGDPFQLQVSIGNGGVTLNWHSPNIQNLSNFKIYRSQQESTGYAELETVANNQIQYTDHTVENGFSYWYRVSAIDNRGNETGITNISAININTNPVFVINSGDLFTPTKTVNLTILANTAQQMMLSNSSDFSGAIWETYLTTKSWTLLTGDGNKIVYLKVKYSDDNESAVVTDSILPQPLTNPTITIASGNDYTPSRNVEITHSIIGESLQIKISEDSSFIGINWQSFITPVNFQLTTGDVIKTVYAKFKNDFEIESQIVFDDILPQPMNPTISIAGGAQYTSTRNVELTFAIAGSNLNMKVSEDSSFTGISWQSFASPTNFQLSIGEGLKKVYAQFKNDFEIESQILNKLITLDMNPPVPILIVTPDSGITNETIFQFDPTGSYDNTFFTDSIRVRYDWENDGSWDTDWGPLININRIYSIGGGDKSIKMELVDGVGLMSDTTINIFINTRPNALYTATENSNDLYIYFFDASASNDYEDGTNLHYRWDFDGDNNWDTPYITEDTITHHYPLAGFYNSKLEIRDSAGLTNINSSTYNVGCIDIDGNTYQVVKIGNQWWMAENLMVTHYRNGDIIPHVTDNSWEIITYGAHCNYNNDPSNVSSYGRLYNGYAIQDYRNISPTGWHVASDSEWKELEMNLGMSQSSADSSSWWRGTDEGGKMKETGLMHWNSPNTGANNLSGFTARAGGWREKVDATFSHIRNNGYFWTSTETTSWNAWYRKLHYDYSQIGRNSDAKNSGLSIRCVRD